jgi:hypothetical protein
MLPILPNFDYFFFYIMLELKNVYLLLYLVFRNYVLKLKMYIIFMYTISILFLLNSCSYNTIYYVQKVRTHVSSIDRIIRRKGIF